MNFKLLIIASLFAVCSAQQMNSALSLLATPGLLTQLSALMKPAGVCVADVDSIKEKIADMKTNIIPIVRDLSPQGVSLVEKLSDAVYTALETNVEFWAFAPYVVGMGVYCTILDVLDMVASAAMFLLMAANSTKDFLADLGGQAALGYGRFQEVIASLREQLGNFF